MSSGDWGSNPVWKRDKGEVFYRWVMSRTYFNPNHRLFLNLTKLLQLHNVSQVLNVMWRRSCDLLKVCTQIDLFSCSDMRTCWWCFNVGPVINAINFCFNKNLNLTFDSVKNFANFKCWRPINQFSCLSVTYLCFRCPGDGTSRVGKQLNTFTQVQFLFLFLFLLFIYFILFYFFYSSTIFYLFIYFITFFT